MNSIFEEYLKKLNQESMFPIDSPHMIKRSNVEDPNLDDITNRSLDQKELEHKKKNKKKMEI